MLPLSSKFDEAIEVYKKILESHPNDFEIINNFDIISGSIFHDQIKDIMKNSHFSIILSTIEGLGLQFYENISTATPILTHTGKPHNEFVKDNINK